MFWHHMQLATVLLISSVPSTVVALAIVTSGEIAGISILNPDDDKKAKAVACSAEKQYISLVIRSIS